MLQQYCKSFERTVISKQTVVTVLFLIIHNLKKIYLQLVTEINHYSNSCNTALFLLYFSLFSYFYTWFSLNLQNETLLHNAYCETRDCPFVQNVLLFNTAFVIYRVTTSPTGLILWSRQWPFDQFVYVYIFILF